MQDLAFLTSYILGSLWFVIPAYFANASPTIVGGGPPIDGGRVWSDGRPVFGPGKTWRGLILGVLIGTVVGLLLSALIREELFKAGMRAFLVSFGSLLGDMIGSFIKRRKGLKRGESFLFMDQLGFIVTGTILVVLFYPITIENVSFELLGSIIDYNPIIVLSYLLFLLPLTFIVHIIANLVSYTLGWQEVKL